MLGPEEEEGGETEEHLDKSVAQNLSTSIKQYVFSLASLITSRTHDVSLFNT